MTTLITLTPGKEVEVEYDTEIGKANKLKGKLISYDTSGYVIIDKNGKQKMIPKNRILSITESGFE